MTCIFRAVMFLIFANRLIAKDLRIGPLDWRLSSAETGPQGEWVLYPLKKSGAATPEKHWLTRQVRVDLIPGVPPPHWKSLPGVVNVQTFGQHQVITLTGNPDAALTFSARLPWTPGVRSAEPLLARQLIPRYTPDDPLFTQAPARPGYQWHLHNNGSPGVTAGVDLNVLPAWNSWRGTGVNLAIVDDGVELTHADLAPHADPAHSHDFNDDDSNPAPGAGDNHGTACAGCAAATGNNSLGGLGTAPEATLTGFRLIAAPTTDAQEADAFSRSSQVISIKSNSWGPTDDARTIAGPGLLSRQALTDAATLGRGGKGTVFVWAAGNGNANGDDSNYDGWANSPLAIAVSAITDHGVQAYYSEPGANILVCAPSNGGSQSITTTDRSGSAGYNTGALASDYADAAETLTFGGTSAAGPLVAGVTALMLEANPLLTYRDVQEILVRTARVIDPTDANWITNGAGRAFNIKYGAGLVDASAATAMAASWTNLPPLETRSLPSGQPPIPIPDASPAGASLTFTAGLPDNLVLEHVTVQIHATHPSRGDLEYRLTSPSGITARLARSRLADTEADLDWTFMATHFRGERSLGDWTLRVIDNKTDDEGTLDSATLVFHGSPAAGPAPAPVITSALNVVGREDGQLSYHITASNFPTALSASGLPPGLNLEPLSGVISGAPTTPGLFPGTITAANGSGTTMVNTVFYILAADPALAAALDVPDSNKIVPFGDAGWTPQSTITHDGIDAARSGTILDNELSGMEFTVAGPATLTYFWKVSSEANYDYLLLAVDGYIQNFISGEQDWTAVEISVGPGLHDIDFDYLKDEIISTGSDAGWVDSLVITPITEPPVITSTTAIAYAGVRFSYQIVATHAPTSHDASGLPAGLAISSATGRISGTVATPGVYPVTLSATNDFGTATATLTLTVAPLSEGLAAAADAPGFAFYSTGSASWFPQSTYAHDGADAARSGTIGNLSQSDLDVQIDGPATGTFYWGISSEPDYDYLRFSIDNVEQAAISGETGWVLRSFNLPAGPHTLKWSYQKDDFVKSGLDSGFLDQLTILQDLDSDGFPRPFEAWFGTSDDDASQLPAAAFAAAGPIGTITFPGVPGRGYKVEATTDFLTWVPLTTITAEAATVLWTDPQAPTLGRRYYRVVIP